jgi:hypothetical protein
MKLSPPAVGSSVGITLNAGAGFDPVEWKMVDSSSFEAILSLVD